MNRSWVAPVGIGVILLMIAGCCVCVLSAAGLWAFNTTSSHIPTGNPTPTPLVVQEIPTSPSSPQPRSPTPAVVQEIPLQTASQVYTGTLTSLDNTIVPVNDLIDLAKRLKNKPNIPVSLDPPATPYKVGDQESFWAANVDTNDNFQVNATLRFVSDHVYFWVENSVNYNQNDLQRLGQTFEQKIYPTDREFFGSEWTPGVDGDPHLYILYAQGLGKTIAGYFSPVDEYTPEAHEYSNAHEMFMLSADNVDLNEEFAYGVLAHEFQHMIHWYRDRNEETWMNEGFSDLAMFLNHYDIGGMDSVYVRNPDLQLTYWPPSSGDQTPHYGESFLFLTYFLDRFGEQATKALVADPANGMASIDQVMSAAHTTDPLTRQPVGADDIFSDWVVASYLQDGSVADGRYTYHNYASAPRPSDTEKVHSCPTQANSRDVSQYGVDYIGITCRGDFTLHFTGSTRVNLLPADPHSGKYAFWSNQGDESDMTLTHSFDFSQHSGPLTLTYWTWYDLEKDYDYVYLEVSLDGQNWKILKTPSGTDKNPSGNSYGWAYNGKSGNSQNWIQENVDISQFAGQKVQFRFEYVTDAAVNGEGFLLDDISIPQIKYAADFENDAGGWQPAGFVRIQNVLPQIFHLALISEGKTTQVQKFTLSGNNTLDVPMHIGSGVYQVTLVVSGTSRFTRQKATYQYSITP